MRELKIKKAKRLIREMADELELPEDAFLAYLRNPSRMKEFVEVRREFVQRGIEQGISLAYLATFLGKCYDTARYYAERKKSKKRL